MAVSISKIAEQIGAKRQLIAKLHAEQAEQFNVVDAQAEAIDKVMAKHKEGGSEPSEEDAKSIKASEDAIAAARLKATELSDQIRAAEAEKAKLEDEKRDREQHNATEQSLNASTGRHIGSDGASLAGAAGTSSAIRSVPQSDKEIDSHIACLMRCVLIAGNNISAIGDIAASKFNNLHIGAAMQSNNYAAGGAMVPDVWMPRLIGALYATTVVRSMGVETLDIEFGSVEMPRISSGATAGYVGEGQDADETALGTDGLRLVPKQLIGLMPLSNTLLAQSGPSADAMLMNQLSIAVGLAEDRNFLRGPKSGAGPTGLRYLSATANVIAANGTVNLVNVDADLGKLELALDGSNVPELRRYWLMAPRTKNYLASLRDPTTQLKAFPEMTGPNPMLRGKPVKTTTTIPINLSGSNSEVYLVEASQQIIGQNPRLEIAASNSASYVNAAGAQVNAFQRNESVFRIVTWNDINTMHPESIAFLTGVTWA